MGQVIIIVSLTGKNACQYFRNLKLKKLYPPFHNHCQILFAEKL